MPTGWSDELEWLKPISTAAALATLWTWETLRPFVQGRQQRLRHGARNVFIAVLNTVVLVLIFSAATVATAGWTERNQMGLLNVLGLARAWRFVAAIVVQDAWLYVWHRLNHTVPLLWQFHRMHHSDREMDVTTATRFHLGEHIGSATLRLAIIVLVGLRASEILIYETLVVAVTMFHHANISLGRIDPWIRWLIVTPRMHQMHHSRLRHETDSNYSVLLSFWDRIGRSFTMRPAGDNPDYGLDEFDGDRWQSVPGMLRTPFGRPEQDTGNTDRP